MPHFNPDRCHICGRASDFKVVINDDILSWLGAASVCHGINCLAWYVTDWSDLGLTRAPGRPDCWVHTLYRAGEWRCGQPASHAVAESFDPDDDWHTCEAHVEMTKSYVRLGNYEGFENPPVTALAVNA